MSKVWVKSVSPNNLHGFKSNQLGLSELTDGLNVVFASNASGKSTLAKSIVNLFQPEALDHEATVNGVVWNGDEFLSLAKRRRDPKFGGFPGRTKDYFLDLQSLLQGLKQDTYVQELLANGFKFSEPIRFTQVDNSREVKQTRERLNQLKEVRRLKQSLVGDEQRLPQLLEAVTEAENAKMAVQNLSSLQEKLALGRKQVELQARLTDLETEYPGIELQNPERVGELEHATKSLFRLHQEEVQIAADLEKIAATSRPERTLAEPDRVRLVELSEELKKIRMLIERSESEVEELNQAAFNEARRIYDLAPDEPLDSLPNLSEEEFRTVARIAELSDEERARTSRLEGLKQALHDSRNPDRYPVAELDRIQRTLTEWLAFEPEVSSKKTWEPLAVVALAACLATPVSLLLVRLMIVVIGIAIAAYLWTKSPGVILGEKPNLEGVPDDFRPKEVNTATVIELIARIADLKAREQAFDRINTIARSVEGPPEDWREVAESIGFQLNDPYRLRLVTEAASTYLKACRDCETVSQNLETLREQERRALAEIREIYFAYRYPLAENRETESVGDFTNWFKLAAQLERKKLEIRAEEIALKDFLDRQGIPEEAGSSRVDRFKERISKARELARLHEEISGMSAKIEILQKPADRAFDHLMQLGTLSESDVTQEVVESEIERQNHLASELEGRKARHQDLLLQIRQAEANGTIRELENSYRVGLGRVEARWESACRESVRFRISEAIRERLMTEDLPPVLLTANDRLYRFSVGRYRLEFARTTDEALGAITVNDLLDGKMQTFSKLSSGTKVHVLLALRLALIEEQEKLTSGGQLKFPLLVDEAMALSDPESSRAIGEALVDIAEERQVIVFTSQDNDVVLLRQLVPNLTVHSLNRQLEVPEAVESGLERTLIAPRAHRFDPRIPIGAHSMAAIFGSSAPNGGQRIDQLHLDLKQSAIVSGLERARRELISRFPRLNWEDCADQKWAQTAFSPRLQELLEQCVGCPHRFLEVVEENRGQAFNRNQVESVAEFLRVESYLIPPVSDSELIENLVKNLEGQNRDSLENYVRMLAIAFIPNFDPDTWFLPADTQIERGIRTFTKRTKKESPLVSGGLFDDPSLFLS